jgi:hypothetical protein
MSTRINGVMVTWYDDNIVGLNLTSNRMGTMPPELVKGLDSSLNTLISVTIVCTAVCRRKWEACTR